MALVVGAAQLKARLTQKTACRPTEMTRRKMPNATVGERGLVLLAHQTPHRGHGIAAVRGSHAFLRLGRSAQDSRGEARGRKVEWCLRVPLARLGNAWAGRAGELVELPIAEVHRGDAGAAVAVRVEGDVPVGDGESVRVAADLGWRGREAAADRVGIFCSVVGGGGDVKTRAASVVLLCAGVFRGPDPPANAGTGGHPARRGRTARVAKSGPLP